MVSKVVVAGAEQPSDLVAMFHAMANGERRRIVETLSVVGDGRGLSIKELVRAIERSRFCVTYHLDILERAGMVDVTSVGTRRQSRLRAEGMLRMWEWADGILVGLENCRDTA